MFRFPLNRLFPVSRPFSEVAARYGGGADAIISAASRTNAGFNAAGAAAAAMGTQGFGFACGSLK